MTHIPASSTLTSFLTPGAVPASEEFQALHKALAAQKDLLDTLMTVGPTTPEALNLTLQKAIEISVRLTGADTGSLFLLDEEGAIRDSLLIRGSASFPEQTALISEVMAKGLAGWVLRQREVGLIEDTSLDPRWTNLPDQPYAVRSALGVPVLRHHALLGILTLIHSQPGHFTADHASLMHMTAQQLALVLDNARLYANLRQELDMRMRVQEALRRAHDRLASQQTSEAPTWEAERREMEFLRREVLDLKTTLTAFLAQKELLEVLVTVTLPTKATVTTVLRKALEIALRHTEAESGSLFLFDESGAVRESLLIRESVTTLQQAELVKGVMERGLAGWVIGHRAVGLIHDTLTDERWATLPNQPYQARSALGVPIMREQTVVGLLTLIHSQPGHFTPDHSHLMQVTALQIALALDNARLYDNLQHELGLRSQAQAALRQANDELEQRVQARTAELALAYEQVRAGRERLQALSQQLLMAQEAERRHIARELHDEMGQSLSALKIDLQGVQRLREASPVAARLEDSIAIVEQVLQQVRALSLDLRPSLLDDMGLEVALRWYLRRQAERTGWEAELVADPMDERLSPEIETVCFRLTQEALTNVARHAQARHVRVELRKTPTQLELIIRDDGHGFDVNTARERALHGMSLGLLGMHERATLMGGQVAIASSAEHGTEIRAHLPLTPLKEKN